ncbi:MAG: hypothetical protein ACOYWZ_17045 [Bacillota bacterium]
MNKKVLRTGIGLVVGFSLFFTSTLISMAGGPSGYETLKASLKNSKRVESSTFTIKGSLHDNNEELVKVNSTVKADKEDKMSSGVVTINSEKVNTSYTFYGKDNVMVFKDDSSDVYNQVECNRRMRRGRFHGNGEFKHGNLQMEKVGETIMDTLVGDLKNQVTQKNLENGKKQLSIVLDKDEVPTVFNMILSAKGQQDCDRQGRVHEILGISKDDFRVPKLVNDAKVEKIDVQIIVDNNNIIKEMDAEFYISGNDENNLTHNQVLKLSIDVSGVNSTEADTINLEGKTVRELPNEDFGC